MKKIALLTLLTGLVVGFSSCSKSSDYNANYPSSANLKVYLTDAPGNYEKVMVDVKSLEINVGSADAENGWKAVENFKPAAFNLLDFSNGIDTLLGSIQLPTGDISQIRLVLGSNNSITQNGVTTPLTVPSSYTSGLKLNLHATLQDGLTYKVWLDFDAGRSIVKTGNNKFMLKPVIRTFADATSGAIKGMISPTAAKPYVMAIVNTDTIGVIADTTGYFMMKGVPTGTYKVVFNPASGYVQKTIDGVVVNLGEIKDLGTVTINTAP